MPRKWHGSSQKRIPPDGTVRQGQLVTTFGPGALMDLVDHAVLVGGLDFWSFDKAKGLPVIHEPRLRDAIAGRLDGTERKLSVEAAFRAPPIGDDREPTKFAGVQVLQFPGWMVCQNPDCRALVRSTGLETKGGRSWHQCTGGKPSLAVPVRFVGACKRGHVTDFPWIPFTHLGFKMCAAANLHLYEGASGDFTEVEVRCSCGAHALLSKAMVTETNPACHGERPWLGSEGNEGCGERLRLLVRTASNSYFAQVVSALSIPEKGNEVAGAVQALWDSLLKVDSEQKLETIRGLVPKVEAGLAPFSNADVLEAIEARRKGKTPKRKPLRTAEFEQLVSQPAETPGELPAPEDDFFARTAMEELPGSVAQVVLASKLREVRAQIGFTRLEPATPDLQGEYALGVQSAPLGLLTDWLPASEIRGEGVFVRLDEKAVQAWEKRPAVQKRGLELLAGYEEWKRQYEDAPEFPGTRFYLLHSLSHLLISAISLECGYAASAIRERIYCAPVGGDERPMAAILLSTGSSGSEGTLGGLVEQGRALRLHLQRAFDLGVLCSNDPVCAGHSPEKDLAERYLEGAACHGCLYIAECSCERFNRYLDRALVVPTIGHDPKLAFFGERP